MQKVLKNIVWGCLIIIPFLALYIASGDGLDIFHAGTSGLFFPFITGKNFAFRILVEIAFASWLLLAIKDAKYRPKKSLLLGAYAVFMFIILVADIFGVDPRNSFLSNFERMEGFVGHIHLFAYFVVLTSFLHTLTDWHKLMKVFVASNVLVLGYGFLQLLGSPSFFLAKMAPGLAKSINAGFPIHMSADRIDSTIGNSAYFAIYCLFFAFISALLYYYAKGKGEKIAYAVIGVLNVLGIFYSGTRGTMAALLIGAIISLAIIAYKEKGHLRKVFGVSLAIVLILASSLFVFKDSDFIKNTPVLSRFSGASLSGALTVRSTIWKMSYEGWLQHPILGYGQDNFSYIFPRFYDAKTMWGQEPWFDRSHDVFFDWLVAGGILGLLSYLSLFAIALYMMWKKDSKINLREKAILTGALAGYFLHNIFVFDNLTSYILFFTILAYIAFHLHTDDKIMLGKKNFGDGAMIFDPLIIALLVIALYYVNYLPHKANTLMINALDVKRASQTMSLDKVMDNQKKDFEEAINLDTIGKQEAIEQLFQISSTMVQIVQSKLPENMSKAESDAIINSTRNLVSFAKTKSQEVQPEFAENVRVLDIMGMFYNTIGDIADAEAVLKHAVEIAPNKQLLLMDLIRTYLIKGDYDNAYALSKRTFLLAPEYGEAKRFFVVTGVYDNKLNEVKTILNNNNQEFIPTDDVISTLISLGKKQEAINLLNEYKKNNPDLTESINKIIQKVIATPIR